MFIRPGRMAPLILALATAALLGNCRKGKNRGGSGASAEDEKESIIGQETEPITPDKVVTLETEESGAVRLLSVEATDTKEAGRHTSEYLLIVRSQAKSCIRLKVRPTAGGVSEAVDESNLEDDQGTAACTVAKEGAGLVSRSPREDTTQLNFTTPTGRALKNREFGLVEQSLCSTRLFRMPVENSEGKIEAVRNKTGRLAYIRKVDIGGSEKKVNVWLDESVNRINCGSDGMNDNSKIAFSPLWKYGYNGYFDQLTYTHVKALADNVAESYKSLAEVYGDVSDVDENSALDVFISPEINRTRFEKVRTAAINQMRVNLNLRTNDLANYDARTNPAGNEGEIVYLWAPDPFGRFAERIFPSSSSLTSNYARGYAGSQIMNLISSKKKLLDRKIEQEENWLREALGLLASAYVGGNAYSYFYKAHYLSSRPQHISLTDPLDESLFTGFSQHNARYEQLGMRAMFGWYLHSLLCGPVLSPCAELGKLLDSDLTGVANLEAATGKKFSKLLEHFGLSLALELVDDPAAARAFWDSPVEGMPEKAADLPSLAELENGDKTQFVRSTINADTHTVVEEPRFAGPFVSYDMELFQPILPDNDLDIKLEKGSVTYILLTGLIEKNTDITATLGQFLNVVIIPIGERQTAATKKSGSKRGRFIHSEKVSENAHFDVAPVNLTSTVANYSAPANDNSFDTDFLYPDATYFMDNEYPELQSEQKTLLSQDREIFVVGNIENYPVSVKGKDVAVGDTDSYNFEISPCKDASDSETCEAKNYQVIIQAYSRDFTSEINPMFLVTSTDPALFRGGEILADVADWDPSYISFLKEQTNWKENTYLFYCDGSGNHSLGVSGKCATNATLYDDGSSKLFFDHFDYMKSKNFSHPYDTFLFMGPLGFPFYNLHKIRDNDDDERAHIFDFGVEEARRMFFDFNFKRENTPNHYVFLRARYDKTAGAHSEESNQLADIPYGDPLLHQVMSEEERLAYLNIKSLMDAWTAQVSEEEAEAFIARCEALGVIASTCAIYGQADTTNFSVLDSAIKATLYTLQGKRKFVSCYGQTSCDSLMNYSGGGFNTATANTSNWQVPYIAANGSETYTSFYNFIYSRSNPWGTDGCNAQTAANPVDNEPLTRLCPVAESAPFSMQEGDIRHQFNVSTADFKEFQCQTTTHVADTLCSLSSHKVSSDAISYARSQNPNVDAYFSSVRQRISGELELNPTTHIPLANLATVAGEITAKEQRFHEQAIKVSGNGSSFMQVIMGGRSKSQGKYILRLRIKEFSEIDPKNLTTGNY